MGINLVIVEVINGKKKRGILLCFFKSFGILLAPPVPADGFAASPPCLQKRSACSQTNMHAAMLLVQMRVHLLNTLLRNTTY